MPKSQPKYDVVVYGATGYTGRLVCEYLVERSRSVGNLSWAMAGRSQEKLEGLRNDIGAQDVPLVLADANDLASLTALTSSTRIVLTTVGPYSLYGTPLVEACATSGTDYCDLTGEPNWMRRMIDDYESDAKKTGARILFCCGFDSIPSELGVWYLQQLAIKKFGKPMPRVRGRVLTFIGGPSGGSVAAGATMFKAAKTDPAYMTLMQDPFALTPGFVGPDQPSGMEPTVEDDVGPLQPFLLGATDAKNVRRSNYLMGNLYGDDFVYDEMILSVKPIPQPAFADLPKPGEGPSKEILAKGRFEILFIGSDPDGHRITARVKGEKDPGYLTTARMIAETALCLREDSTLPGGMWAPGAAFQDKLVNRLTKNAHMTFEPGED